MFDDLKGLATSMRQEVLSAVAGGEDYDQALERVLSDQAFADWLAGFQRDAENILSK